MPIRGRTRTRPPRGRGDAPDTSRVSHDDPTDAAADVPHDAFAAAAGFARVDPLAGESPPPDPAAAAAGLILSGLTPTEILAGWDARPDLAPDDPVAAIEDARDRIRAAADVDAEREIGEAVAGLREIVRAAVAGGDARTALAARKELNRLLDLPGEVARRKERAGEEEGATERLAAAASYLDPLGLAPEGTDVPELARLAAVALAKATAAPRPKKTPKPGA